MRFLFFTLFLISASWALECYTGTFSYNGYMVTNIGEWFRCEHSCPNFKGKSQVVVEIPGGTVAYCTKAEGSCRFRHW
ncbi:hypothetical protein PRIPAC_88656 [Pristionchus pacificus]|uniref:Uncharacterized protein n=1 Tax=Pristionchus pacificus TaxID=54126 RepID=A0A2A6B9J8_PRIPA|nr:hypothetical protein PRIPAC_88656 [Pristionchus pacificus]|eukprot:PDM62555.1 hypothetical protein PRIPAC_51997 [Pristionchus pacificus]